MRFLCWFRTCNWLWLFDAAITTVRDEPPANLGVYQCARCKNVSIGASGAGRGLKNWGFR